MKFRLIPEEEMARRHAAVRQRVQQERPTPAIKLQNQRAILDLGNLTFFTFQGRAFGVPPLPYKAGQLLSRLSMDLRKYTAGLTEENLPQYYAVVAQIPPLLWQLSRPVGRVRRFLARLGLHPNPFRHATEAELGELLGFFSTLRTKSSVLSLPAQPLHADRIS